MKAEQKEKKRGGLECMNEDMLTAARVLGNILVNPPKVIPAKHHVRDADLTFSVPISELIESSRKTELRQMLQHRFYADFIGEVLVRCNTQKFLDAMGNGRAFDLAVKCSRHRHFGVGIDRDKVVFSFYASKLSDVVNDEMENILRN